jgi:hypothetical protein
MFVYRKSRRRLTTFFSILYLKKTFVSTAGACLKKKTDHQRGTSSSSDSPKQAPIIRQWTDILMSVLRWENRLATMINDDVSLANAVDRLPILVEEVNLSLSVNANRQTITNNRTSGDASSQQRGTATNKSTTVGLQDKNISRVKSGPKLDNDKMSGATGKNQQGGKAAAALSTTTVAAVAQKRKAQPTSSALTRQNMNAPVQVEKQKRKMSSVTAAVPTESASSCTAAAGVHIDSDVEILEELLEEENGHELEENGKMGSSPAAPPPSPVMKRRKMEHGSVVDGGGRKRGGMYLENKQTSFLHG